MHDSRSKKEEEPSDAGWCVQQLSDFLELGVSNRVAAKCGRTRVLDASRLSNLWSHAALAHPAKPSSVLTCARWRPADFPVDVHASLKLALRSAFMVYAETLGSHDFLFMGRAQWLSMCRTHTRLSGGVLAESEASLVFDAARVRSTAPAPGGKIGLADWAHALLHLAQELLPGVERTAAFEAVAVHIVASAPTRSQNDAHGTAVLSDGVLDVLDGARAPLARIYAFYVHEQEIHNALSSENVLVSEAKSQLSLQGFLRFTQDFGIVPQLLTKIQAVEAFRGARFGPTASAASKGARETLRASARAATLQRAAAHAGHSGHDDDLGGCGGSESLLLMVPPGAGARRVPERVAPFEDVVAVFKGGVAAAAAAAGRERVATFKVDAAEGAARNGGGAAAVMTAGQVRVASFKDDGGAAASDGGGAAGAAAAGRERVASFRVGAEVSFDAGALDAAATAVSSGGGGAGGGGVGGGGGTGGGDGALSRVGSFRSALAGSRSGSGSLRRGASWSSDAFLSALQDRAGAAGGGGPAGPRSVGATPPPPELPMLGFGASSGSGIGVGGSAFDGDDDDDDNGGPLPEEDLARLGYEEFVEGVARLGLAAYSYTPPPPPPTDLGFTQSYESTAKALWMEDARRTLQDTLMDDGMEMPRAFTLSSTGNGCFGISDGPDDALSTVGSMLSRANSKVLAAWGGRSSRIGAQQKEEIGDVLERMQVHDAMASLPGITRPFHLTHFSTDWVGAPPRQSERSANGVGSPGALGGPGARSGPGARGGHGASGKVLHDLSGRSMGGAKALPRLQVPCGNERAYDSEPDWYERNQAHIAAVRAAREAAAAAARLQWHGDMRAAAHERSRGGAERRMSLQAASGQLVFDAPLLPPLAPEACASPTRTSQCDTAPLLWPAAAGPGGRGSRRGSSMSLLLASSLPELHLGGEQQRSPGAASPSSAASVNGDSTASVPSPGRGHGAPGELVRGLVWPAGSGGSSGGGALSPLRRTSRKMPPAATRPLAAELQGLMGCV
ncbi:hypothetical protein FOA52_008996 [Chlamydomonas sp. UWO 241]|nr:hypothetical protein FOA52_008996 [Chlamydomonas sp. UWO 241]